MSYYWKILPKANKLKNFSVLKHVLSLTPGGWGGGGCWGT